MAVDINSKIGQVIRKLVPFSTLSKFHFNELCREITIEKESEGFVLFNKGDETPDLFYLLSGEITLQADEYTFETIAANTDAARFAIAHQIPRQIDAIAKTGINFIRVDATQISNPPQANTEENSYMVSDESEESPDDWMTTLLKSPIFQRLPAANLQQILISLEEVDFQQGQNIVQQGESSAYYYLIRKGQCKMTRKPSSTAKEIQIGLLQDRDTFGEDSLLLDEPSNLTITALTDISLLRLEKAKFITLISKPSIQFIDFESIPQEITQGAILLDVRLPDVYKNDHLDNSKNIPFFSLSMQIKSFNRKRKVIVICADGRLSEAAAFLLIKNKINAVILAGGMKQVTQDSSSQNPVIATNNDLETILPPASVTPSEQAASGDYSAAPESSPTEINPLLAENAVLKQANCDLKKQCTKFSTEKALAERQLQSLSTQLKKLRAELDTLQSKA